MLADARRFGMDEPSLAQLGAAMRAPRDEGDGVWPENWDIVMAFLAVSSQWRTASVGGGMSPASLVFVGLDYGAVRAGLEAEQIAITPALWRGLRVMENAATAALNEAGS